MRCSRGLHRIRRQFAHVQIATACAKGRYQVKSSNPVIRGLRASPALLLAWIAPHAPALEMAVATSDEIFTDGFEPAGVAIPLTSPQADFLYTARVTIGDQNFALSIDTGSTTLGVAGATCAGGCTGVTPLYSPSASAHSTGHTASTTYADNSGWSGNVFSDTVGLDNGSPSVSLDLVEITHAKSFFVDGNEYQGILGLGPQQNAEPNTTAYLPALVAAGVDNVFAFDLCDNTGADAGTMWLGGDGGVTSVQYTPLVPISNNNPFYAINVDALSLGNTNIVTNASSTFEEPVLDTGTSLFYVPTSVYQAFKTTLSHSAAFQALFGTSQFDGTDCVTASSMDAQVNSELPLIALSLPNLTSGQPDITIQASALDTYLYYDDDGGGGGGYCLAIQDGGTQDASTFGDAFMQAFHIVIDVTGSRVGFAPRTTCAAPALSRSRHPTQIGPHRPPRLPRP